MWRNILKIVSKAAGIANICFKVSAQCLNSEIQIIYSKNDTDQAIIALYNF